MDEYIKREEILCMVQPDDPSDEKAAITISTAKKLIRSLAYRCPAADVEPVMHGRWIKKQEKDTFAGYLYSYECSECGRVEQRKEPYCPNCGAKMGDKLYG